MSIQRLRHYCALQEKELPVILQLPKSPFLSHNGACFGRLIFLQTITSLNCPSHLSAEK
jgi:hypothetical protein